MQQQELPSTAHPSFLKPISPNVGYADYLGELTHELPYSVSQYGIVLVSALELRDRRNKDENHDIKSKEPEGSKPSWTPNIESPHFRCSLPVRNANEEEISTVIDVTVAPHANTIYVRREHDLMRAAAVASKDGSVEENHFSFKATADNFAVAAKHDPIINGHQANAIAAMKEIINRPAIEDSSSDDDKLQWFYCINDIWVPALRSIGNVFIANRCVKYVITEEQLLKDDPEIRRRCQEIEETEGLVLGPMVESDVPLMIASNTVKFDEEYGRFIIKRSFCFRNKKGEMVGWAGTHGDFSIAALHVLPQYRKMGLGRLIIHSLAMSHIKLARDILAMRGEGAESISSKTLIAHADCLDNNHPTMVFMERCGWKRIGYYLWVSVDQTAKE
ncbi:hypothetical protein FBU30_005075 [Linnemannia zychae]|nr:hypothetical protein FBU30_005075 [Linnemannia zychae]